MQYDGMFLYSTRSSTIVVLSQQGPADVESQEISFFRIDWEPWSVEILSAVHNSTKKILKFGFLKGHLRLSLLLLFNRSYFQGIATLQSTWLWPWEVNHFQRVETTSFVHFSIHVVKLCLCFSSCGSEEHFKWQTKWTKSLALVHLHYCIWFLPREAMLTQYMMSSCVCLSVTRHDLGIVSRRLNVWSS